MHNEDNKIIKYNQGEKSISSPIIIYADLECLLEKISTCYNNFEESSTAEINKHTPSGYSLFTHCSFDKTKNKLDYYRDDNCMEKFCKGLREHATKIINYEKKKMIPLTKKEEKNYNKQKVCYICKKEFNTYDSDKKYHKVKDNCHYTKDEKLILRCFSCKKNYEKDFNKGLIERFANIYEFCNGDLNKFILLLRKGVYPYEYMDNWESFDETSLPDKESFYSSLNMENIDDIDYRHGNNVFKKFKLKNLGEYHDL